METTIKISNLEDIVEYVSTNEECQNSKKTAKGLKQALLKSLEMSDEAIYVTENDLGVDIAVKIDNIDNHEKTRSLANKIYNWLPTDDWEAHEIVESLLLVAAKVADDNGVSFATTGHGKTSVTVRKGDLDGEGIAKAINDQHYTETVEKEKR